MSDERKKGLAELGAAPIVVFLRTGEPTAVAVTIAGEVVDEARITVELVAPSENRFFVFGAELEGLRAGDARRALVKEAIAYGVAIDGVFPDDEKKIDEAVDSFLADEVAP